MKKFLSCDWGTSSFRLRWVDAETRQVIFSQQNNDGISSTYHAWKAAGGIPENRMDFYQKVIGHQIKKIESMASVDLSGTPLVITGMASSSIGMKELPYKILPIALDGSDAETFMIGATKQFPFETLIISGAATGKDVMRGEETLLMGLDEESFPGQEAIVLFPGTHSKHVALHDNRAAGLKTYMTGEFFELLSSKSILSASVSRTAWAGQPHLRKAFLDGVKTGPAENLLHSAFFVRTNSLFHQLKPDENYYFLSGLLIGHELSVLAQQPPSSLMLVSDSTLASLYEEALNTLGIIASLRKFKKADATDLLIQGQLAVCRHFMK